MDRPLPAPLLPAPLLPAPPRAPVALAALTLTFTLAIAPLTLGCGGSPPEVATPGPTPGSAVALPPVAPGDLRAPEAFAAITDRDERSRALFMEASRVLMHPRCLNCHPDGDTPAQGDTMIRHEPPVLRGPVDNGIVGLECTSCHQDKNLELARVPGAEKWHLAPRVMAWINRTPSGICEQVKDRNRNGGKSLAEIVDHSAHDKLVAWGWDPGSGRTPAPGTQAKFGALVAAWAESGAACPREEAKR